MYYLEHETAMLRMADFARARETDRLTRDLRRARRPRRSVGARTVAFAMTLFHV